MKNFLSTARLDISESLRARWFVLYSVVFGGLALVLAISGVTESRVMGFSGLSRILLIYIQLCMGILPIFILLTTVRSVAGDREAGVVEYLLSLPVSLRTWFWGKIVGRFVVVFLPVILAMAGVVIWAMFGGHDVPWIQLAFNTGFTITLVWCFLGFGMFISSIVRSPDVAQGIVFVVWLILLLFIDLIFIGVMISGQFSEELIIMISLLNPLQVFRTGTMLLFDPELMLMGPAAFVIIDNFGRELFLVFALVYPAFLGTLSAWVGYLFFKRSDLP